jgi:hypothetical protein
MPTLATARRQILAKLPGLALAFAFIGLSAADASAQLFQNFREHLHAHNRAFYGPLYDEYGYADSLGLRGHARCENGGYYGRPQMYTRQYGRIAGYRTDPPFAPFYLNNGPGYSGDFDR